MSVQSLAASGGPRAFQPPASSSAGARARSVSAAFTQSNAPNRASCPAVSRRLRVKTCAAPETAHKAETNGASLEEALPEFSVIMEVRDNELDQYSVVNNAVYNNYLQHARHKLLEHVGCDADEVARTGDALALASMNIRYLGPLRSRDIFAATVTVKKITGVRLVLGQEVRKTLGAGEGSAGETVTVLEAEAVVVWLDKDYKPKRIPKEQIAKFRQFSESVQIQG